MLAIDLNGDGQVNDGSEIVFGGNGLTDLEGLAAKYDSNHDGVLDAQDDAFAKFGVWQDANSNGITDAGEFQTLTAAGIVSIGLVSDGIGYTAANGDVVVAGQSTYTLTDGSTGIAADASFAVAPATLSNRLLEQSRDAGFNAAIVAASLVAVAATAPTALADDTDHNATANVAPLADAVLPEAIADDTHLGDTVATVEYFASELVSSPQLPVETSHAQSESELTTEHQGILDETFASSEVPVQQDTQAGDAKTGGFMLQPIMNVDAAMESLLALADKPVDANSVNALAEPTGFNDVVHDILLESTIDRFIANFSQDHPLLSSGAEHAPIDAQALQALLDQVITPSPADVMMASTGFDFQMHDMAVQHG